MPSDSVLNAKGTSFTRAAASAEETSALAPEGQPGEEPQPAPSSDIDRVQTAVLQALNDGSQRIIASMLASGEWAVQANELVIKVSDSQTIVDMSFGPEAKRLAIASASGVLGRAMRLKIIPGATVAPPEKKNNGARPSGPGGRTRAEQDPVVRRMQEKFGAEIRTVIDYKEKR